MISVFIMRSELIKWNLVHRLTATATIATVFPQVVNVISQRHEKTEFCELILRDGSVNDLIEPG